MSAREILSAMYSMRGITQTKNAASLGWSNQKLGQKLIRGTLRADDFIRLLDEMDIDVEYRDRRNGELIKIHKEGYGHRIKGVSDGIRFDTGKAEALSNNFYEDGEHEYGKDGRAVELYVDAEGRYFFAEYSCNEGEKNRIRSTTAGVAAAFIEKYGPDLHLDKKEQNEATEG